ncbi:MAG: NAD(P)H nitroreductase [Candidatus Aenigmatarchaeota archaeon]|nr:MAG: NAD(P)H nitroreductase [Candidatus Aenigmarchaeota archaeon]
MDVISAIRKRRSIRRYSDREVEDEKLKVILKAAMFSPSAMHLRPWHFVVVRDKEIRERLSKVTEWAYFLREAPLNIVVCGDKNAKRWIEDCSIAAEHIMLQATELGLGSCWVAIHNSSSNPKAEEEVKETLAIPDNFGVLCIIAIGYRGEEKEEHSDKEFEEEKVHYDHF